MNSFTLLKTQLYKVGSGRGHRCYFLEHGSRYFSEQGGFIKRFMPEWTRQRLWWVMTILWQTGRFRHHDGDRVKLFLLVCFLCVNIFLLRDENVVRKLQYISPFSCTMHADSDTYCLLDSILQWAQNLRAAWEMTHICQAASQNAQ